MKPRVKAEPLPDFKMIYVSCFGMWPEKHKLASEFFGVSEQTCRRWYEGTPNPVAHRYLTVHYKGYLPYNTHWQQCYIDHKDGHIVTPWGRCSPGELAFLWRYKWNSEVTSRQLKATRQKLEELTSGTKYKMLLHTADYLNRLVKEFSGDN